MEAVILSAGQGKRLLPLTTDQPKCIVSINGRSILEWQIQELIRLGMDSIHVVVGFGANKVEALLAQRVSSSSIHTIYNPFFALADNLISCWVAAFLMSLLFLGSLVTTLLSGLGYDTLLLIFSFLILVQAIRGVVKLRNLRQQLQNDPGSVRMSDVLAAPSFRGIYTFVR